jgi:hypothetical protein
VAVLLVYAKGCEDNRQIYGQCMKRVLTIVWRISKQFHGTISGFLPVIVDEIYLAERSERLTANAKVATVLGSIPASYDTVKSEQRQMTQCYIKYLDTNKRTDSRYL